MLEKKYLEGIICLVLLFSVSLSGAKSFVPSISYDPLTNNYQYLGKQKNNLIIIDEEIDLKGLMCELPQGGTLVFKYGGRIKNGTLIGNETKIKCKRAVFDKVTIKGVWNVPKISTCFFVDLNYTNSLRDVVALTNPKIQNTVFVEKGEYLVEAYLNDEACVEINGNTKFILDGTIRMNPNGFTHYSIIRVSGENIIVKGRGSIIGDKHNHMSNDGEWGMGIDLRETVNARVEGVTVKDCWGDCIFVDNKSKNILVSDCKLDNSRRQGISIIWAENVRVKDCLITNIGGTAPEYAIDIEPDIYKSVDNVIIENVRVKNCQGGIMVYGGAVDAHVGNVLVKNCEVSAFKNPAVYFIKCSDATLKSSYINQHSAVYPIRCEGVETILIENNQLICKNSDDIMRGAPSEYKESTLLIDIRYCGKITLNNNKEN